MSSFDSAHLVAFTARNPLVPMTATLAYLAMLAMPIVRPWNVRGCMVAWNIALAAFSIYGASITVPDVLYNNKYGALAVSLEQSVCYTDGYWNGTVGVWIFLFVYSKLVELVDTLWLVLTKREAGFLHVYHHISVLWYCWYSYAIRSPTGLWFASMNFTVHGVMYTYYALALLPQTRAIRRVGSHITRLQILQMVGGMIANYKALSCRTVPRENIALATFMYFSYFCLFVRYYVQRNARMKTHLKTSHVA